jgi:Putative peptidoglycan binding domain
MDWKTALLLVMIALAPAGAAHADELTQIVQESLITLGYDPGPANGKATTKTIIAVAKFQTLNNLEPTGEITPQLAGIIQASTSKQAGPATASRPATAAAAKPDTSAIPGPGASVRNIFGPDVGMGANQCRGACGGSCPKSCEKAVYYECTGSSQLRRVEAFTCGTHPGCREHDACLDNCLQNNPNSGDCQSQCDATAMEVYGFENSASWALGKGPYDGETIFEYTRYKPSELEAAYHCPEGTRRQCGDTPTCIAANGSRVDPVFDTYPGAGSGGMRISGLRTGPLCANGDRVCEQSATIRMTGTDSCASGTCTRFGMEFDYVNAAPSAPLECATSTRGGEDDFIGDLIKLGGDALSTRSGSTDETSSSAGGEDGDGMGQLLGMFAKVIASGDSPEDVQVTMTVTDENGITQTAGSEPTNGPAPIPRTIALPAASGHLFVPMYQLAESSTPGVVKERRVTCTHKGEPVLVTAFVLE